MVYCDVPYGSDVLITYMVDINYMMKKLRDQIGCLYAKVIKYEILYHYGILDDLPLRDSLFSCILLSFSCFFLRSLCFTTFSNYFKILI